MSIPRCRSGPHPAASSSLLSWPARRRSGAPFIGALAYEAIRTIAVSTVPGTWQMILGAALLLTILFVPQGIGGLIFRRRRVLGAKQ